MPICTEAPHHAAPALSAPACSPPCCLVSPPIWAIAWCSTAGSSGWPGRWAVYLYVFSLPFEMPERSIPVEVTTLTGILLMVAALLQARICYRRPPAAFWWFAGYLVVFVFAAILLSNEYQRSAVKLLIQL